MQRFRDKLDFHGLLQRDGKSKRAALDVLLKLGLGLRPLLQPGLKGACCTGGHTLSSRFQAVSESVMCSRDGVDSSLSRNDMRVGGCLSCGRDYAEGHCTSTG